MLFIINQKKYDTEKMEAIGTVKKWYQVDNFLIRNMYPGKEVGRIYDCTVWKSEKGNFLLTHEEDYTTHKGEAITEEEAKALLMRYAPGNYEKRYGEIEEA